MLVLYVYNIYIYVFKLDSIKIDFLAKEIEITNRFPGINYFRKIFRRPVSVAFHEIIEFKNYKRAPGRFMPRGNVLVVKTNDHSPIKIAEFRFEKDSSGLAGLLNEYIVGKPGIIE